MSYRLIKKIAMGGMAEIYLATRESIGDKPHIYCIKKILPSSKDDKEFISMFHDEYATGVRLKHPNIVQIKELITINQTPAIVMEYISGVDIRDILIGCERQKIQLPIPLACFMILEIAKGLDYVHKLKGDNKEALKIVHRDMSPQNVLISLDGQVKIIDFGIADRDSKLNVTKAGVVKGKFSYMSPEQVLTKPIDHRTDQFSIGVIFWEMLAMQKLFLRPTEVETIDLVRSAKITKELTEINKEVDDELSKIIHKTLSKNIKSRFADCAEFVEDLNTYMVKTFGRLKHQQYLSEFIHKILPQKEKKIKALIEQAYAEHNTPLISEKDQENPLKTLPKKAARIRVKNLRSHPKKTNIRFDQVVKSPQPIKTHSSPQVKKSSKESVDSSLSSVTDTDDELDLVDESLSISNSMSVFANQPFTQAASSSYQPYTPKEPLLTPLQKKGAIAIAAACLLFLFIPKTWNLTHSSSASSASQSAQAQIKMIPKNMMIKINGKLLKSDHLSSPAIIKATDLRSGMNTLEFSRKGFISKTIQVNNTTKDLNRDYLITLLRADKLTNLQLSIHPRSSITNVPFKIEKNVDSGTLKKGSIETVPYLMRGQIYTVIFKGPLAFTCRLKTSKSNDTLAYQVYIEKKSCSAS